MDDQLTENGKVRYYALIKAMRLDDSFFIPAAQVGRWFNVEARRLAAKLEINLSIYRRTEEGIDGWRIWRNR